MTDAVWITLISTLPTLIGSIVTSFLAFAAWRQGIANSTKTDQSIAKADTIIEKAVEIHTLTNSNLSKVTAANEVLTSKVEGLERLITNMVASRVATERAVENQKAKDLNQV